MSLRLQLAAAFGLSQILLIALRAADAPPQLESPPTLPTSSTASFEKRLAAAESVKVKMSILGLNLGSTLEEAHKKLDKLCDAAHRPKEEEEEDNKEGERKVLWELVGTQYGFVFVKADEKERITYLSGYLRPGKEIPFSKIGEMQKAPIQTPQLIAWDVVRPKQPPSRVIASGEHHKANSIMVFVVKRTGLHPSMQDAAR
jgi:hypothetical protein